MNSVFEGLVVVATAIIGVAILAVLVANKSNTTGVITAAGNAFSNALGVAESPITGASSGGNSGLSLPTLQGFSSGG